MRFPFYDKPWQITTIGNCCRSLDYGLGASAIDYDGKHKYIRITDIDEETNTFSNINITSPSFYDEEHKVKINDILFARTGASVGKTYCYNPKDGELYYAGFLIAAHVKNEFDPKFIFYNTVTTRYKNWVKIMSARSGQPGINADEYRSHTFYIPIKDEQLKISAFLSKLDERILLQNKIIEDLYSVKNEISNRIFNLQTIEKSPNCLSEYLSEGDKIPVDTSQYRKITIKLNKQGIVYSEINRDMADTRPFYVRHKGELIIGKQNYFNGSIAIVDDLYDNCICSNAIMSFSVSGINKDFLYYQISNNNYLNSQSYKANGTGQKELSEKEFLKFKIWCPTLEIQTKIVNCFKSIDCKIENEKAILDSYIKEKNYLLNNLFI